MNKPIIQDKYNNEKKNTASQSDAIFFKLKVNLYHNSKSLELITINLKIIVSFFALTQINISFISLNNMKLSINEFVNYY